MVVAAKETSGRFGRFGRSGRKNAAVGEVSKVRNTARRSSNRRGRLAS